ncbi:MAG: MGMT family protein [Deltaproteobacteria bacterium]|nr:MAG: MGMT family protein [Deltaproteobacteria bacterium]
MVSFYEQVYAVVRKIPPGKVTSYGRVAQMLWAPQAARAVGYALRNLRNLQHNPAYRDVPWQRVVSSTGVIRVASPGDKDPLQVELLRDEGVKVKAPDFKVDMKRFLWEGLDPDEIGELLEELEERFSEEHIQEEHTE